MSPSEVVNGEPPAGGSDARTCLACRGTGNLISGLGGEPHQVSCPWCRGSGERIPGIDAQDAPAESGAPVESGAPADAGPPPAS